MVRQERMEAMDKTGADPTDPLPHYFHRFGGADPDDLLLKACIRQGYVPEGCLLAGWVVMGLMRDGADPCDGCAGPRQRCRGRTKPMPLGGGIIEDLAGEWEPPPPGDPPV